MWTMEELVDRVRAALAAEYSGAPNGRVRDLPDPRSIRWYSTIGLVDRPLGTRGRNALYGPRHLLQLVAIKRRQAAGRTLAEIQAELAGAPEQTLTEVARVPAELLSTDPPPAPEAARPPFWKSAPAAPAADWAFPADHNPPFGTPPGAPDVLPPPADPGLAPLAADALLTGVPLGLGVILLVPGALHAGRLDRAELATAARPLLDLLASRGLTDRRDQ
ncbi:MerR family transcriptional regulator [Actinoplanes oblitus]|uniref:MerR family transcriptional regulator n=1 Tax=Actinoplanes oblitus TaxID=3040509 RepID=A0ABY8WME3_9ACTN|nr:MerR family transcriptional regulator [Actinoplanes oblitus]WIM99066.1 MerR family transcriptional regulator [Actinoplanes oblitus]